MKLLSISNRASHSNDHAIECLEKHCETIVPIGALRRQCRGRQGIEP
ncbi:hypothetical protein DP57_6229 [Burkholderia pseudomallei]|nr:hypothetical protein DP57_6229 [Burkholderia pseudomallei]KGX61085.1 hypothetical protein Y025_2549 [Burkholderia pseudomallei TSV32]